MQKKFSISVRLAVLGLVSFCALVPSASANSTAYDVTATFADGQVLNGTVTYNIATQTVAGYSFTLSGTTGTDTCSGNCTLLSLLFTYGSYSEKVTGILSPYAPLLGFAEWNNSGYFNYTVSDDKWAPVQVPEGPVAAMLISALALIGSLVFRSPRLRRQS